MKGNRINAVFITFKEQAKGVAVTLLTGFYYAFVDPVIVHRSAALHEIPPSSSEIRRSKGIVSSIPKWQKPARKRGRTFLRIIQLPETLRPPLRSGFRHYRGF